MKPQPAFQEEGLKNRMKFERLLGVMLPYPTWAIDSRLGYRVLPPARTSAFLARVGGGGPDWSCRLTR